MFIANRISLITCPSFWVIVCFSKSNTIAKYLIIITIIYLSNFRQSSKISCYKKFYGQLKTDPSISGLGYPDEKSNFDLFCSIGDTKVNYSLRDKIDLLSIKAEKHYPGLTDDQLQNLGKNLVDGTNYSVTHYDGKLILQSNLTFVGVADHEAEKQVHDFAERFFEFLKSKVSEMDVPTAEKTIENN